MEEEIKPVVEGDIAECGDLPSEADEVITEGE